MKGPHAGRRSGVADERAKNRKRGVEGAALTLRGRPENPRLGWVSSWPSDLWHGRHHMGAMRGNAHAL
jgi:hypothetical protein